MQLQLCTHLRICHIDRDTAKESTEFLGSEVAGDEGAVGRDEVHLEEHSGTAHLGIEDAARRYDHQSPLQQDCLT